MEQEKEKLQEENEDLKMVIQRRELKVKGIQTLLSFPGFMKINLNKIKLIVNLYIRRNKENIFPNQQMTLNECFSTSTDVT